jgi:5-methylcytosine-specific restriction enzyme subunit McrC
MGGRSGDPAHWKFLPRMVTDIILRAPHRTVVVDAKYYKEALSTHWHGGEKVRSDHLYQLFTYMEHVSKALPLRPVDGALIYPAVGSSISLRYDLSGHSVAVETGDLARSWQEIRARLLGILSTQ